MKGFVTIMANNNLVKSILFMVLILNGFVVFSQCPNPRLYDVNLVSASANPTWENCIDNQSDPNTFVLNLVSPKDIKNYKITFGDGSPQVTGALLSANTALQHTYNSLGQFTVTLSETDNGCTKTITGKVVNDRKPGASAEPPTIGSSGCVPHTLTFINKTTNTSAFTKFEWNWGDGTVQVVGAATAGQPISHTYVKGKAGCGMSVRITAMGLCDTSFSIYGPYDFWDIDTAVVQASATELCVGDTVTFTDVSKYNCNIKQPRKIKWDFTSLGGPVTGWLPAVGANRSKKYFVSGPVGSSYTVILYDSNYCGVAQHAVTVRIIAPPKAILDIPDPLICAGEKGVVNNTSTGGANQYIWNFGDGSPSVTSSSKAPVSHQYNTPGTYTVKLIAKIGGTQFCLDSAKKDITVLPAPVSDFIVDKTSSCGPLTVNITDKSVDAVKWSWNFGNGNTAAGSGPFTEIYTNPGIYIITLTTENIKACTSSKSMIVKVFPEATASIKGDSVCLGNPTFFKDLSSVVSTPTGSIIREQWDNINGGGVLDLTKNTNYPDNPSLAQSLINFESPSNAGDNFGARIRGFITAPTTGDYVFWIASDDNSELWLSTTADPAKKVKIASVSGSTSSQQWTKFPSQKSANISLVGGRKYYIEALHKEGGGSDHLAVGWQLPGGTLERPIPGNRLSQYTGADTIQKWSWDFGDGTGTSDLKDPSYQYNSTGTFNVSLTVMTAQCTSTTTIPVKVFPNTKALFTLGDTAHCTPFHVSFFNKSTNGAKYIWDFGDGSPVEVSSRDTVLHTFINNGNSDKVYIIKLISEVGGCRDSIERAITVYPGPEADFVHNPSVPKCSPVEITFTNKSGAAASSYIWYVGSYDTLTTTNIKHTFINKTGAIKEDTVKLQALSATGCYGEISKIITVFPEPDFGIVATPDTGCHPLNVNFSISNFAAAPYKWNFGDGTAVSTPNPTIAHEFRNLNSKDTVFEVRLIANSPFGCPDTVYKNIVVHPNSVADFDVTPIIQCSPIEASFTNSSIGAIKYTWYFGDGDSSTEASASFKHRYSNKSNATKIYNIKLISENAGGCISTKEKTIKIHPEVNSSFTVSDSSGCSPYVVSFTNASTVAKFYKWDFGDSKGDSGTNPSHQFKNDLLKDTVYQVMLVAISAENCQDTSYKNIVVHPATIAKFTMDKTEGCTPLKIEFDNISTGASLYKWDFGDSTFSNSADKILSHTFDNQTASIIQYQVKLYVENSNGCQDSIIKIVKVYPKIRASFTGDSVGCSPFRMGFMNNTFGAKKYTWDFGDGSAPSSANSPIHTFVNNSLKDTSYQVIMVTTSTNGCMDTSRRNIVVYPKPLASFTADQTEGCSPLKVLIKNQSAGGDIRFWIFSNSDTLYSSGNDFNYTFINTGTSTINYQIKLVVRNSNGCSDSLTKSVKVYPQVSALFRSDSIGCAPFKVVFQNNSIGAVKYTWDFGDGSALSTQVNPGHTFYNTGRRDTVYTVMMTTASSNNCTDTAYTHVVVHPRPVAQFIPDALEGCSPFVLALQNTSEGASKFNWNFGDGTSSDTNAAELSHLFANNTGSVAEYKLRLLVLNAEGCSDSVVKIIKVFPRVTSKFSADSIGCSPMKAIFQNKSVGASRYSWNFGDGSAPATLINPEHDFVNNSDRDTIYQVMLIAISANNCTDTAYMKIKVYANPVAQLNTNTVEGCSPLVVNVKNNSAGASRYRWDFGDGSTSDSSAQSFNHTFENISGVAMNYVIKLTVENINGCKNFVTKTIKVYPKVTASFLSDSVGCSPTIAIFQNTSIGANKYRWNFGDGFTSSSVNPRHIFANPLQKDTIYSVQLIGTSTNGCTDTAYNDILIHPTPVAQFDPDTLDCSPLVVRFKNLSQGATKYFWDMGDNTTMDTSAAAFEYTYRNRFDKDLKYKVSLYVQNVYGCKDTASNTFIVYPEVTASFSTDTAGCAPFTPVIKNNSINAATYSWDFGDGNSLNAKEASHTFENYNIKDTVYTMTLTVVSNKGCTDVYKKNITVYAQPNAAFSASPTSAFPGSPISIFNNTEGNWNYEWDFGDKTAIVQAKDPGSYVYNKSGDYKIMLTASSAHCESKFSQNVKIIPIPPKADFTGSGSGCSPLKVKFENKSTYGHTYIWDFGDGSLPDTLDNTSPVEHTYYKSGLFSVSLKVIGSENLVDFKATPNIIKVSPSPEVRFQAFPDTVYLPKEVTFVNGTSNASIYHWDFGDGTSSSAFNPTHQYISPGVYEIKLTASTSDGCKAEFKLPEPVTALQGGKIRIPNAFTPSLSGSNGGIAKPNGNDVFFPPFSEGVEEYTMHIFNRWGELIFETKDLNIGWDGYYRGELCKEDVYVYKIYVKFSDGNKQDLVGDVTLIRNTN